MGTIPLSCRVGLENHDGSSAGEQLLGSVRKGWFLPESGRLEVSLPDCFLCVSFIQL